MTAKTPPTRRRVCENYRLERRERRSRLAIGEPPDAECPSGRATAAKTHIADPSLEPGSISLWLDVRGAT